MGRRAHGGELDRHASHRWGATRMVGKHHHGPPILLNMLVNRRTGAPSRPSATNNAGVVESTNSVLSTTPALLVAFICVYVSLFVLLTRFGRTQRACLWTGCLEKWYSTAGPGISTHLKALDWGAENGSIASSRRRTVQYMRVAKPQQHKAPL
ncbi:hypothetical protein V496_02906 [Pseudogymnoascus sp. VKM F-4515 (FW-2607)]|nr:hypothetical protein V496_02906 [Pseudogymnoascus sp. VKM F-4515 (FW-2607)]